MQIAFTIFKYFPHGGIQRDLMKMARECLRRGHRVRIYAIRWNAPPPVEDIDLQIISVEALSNHRLYERFAEQMHEHVRANPVDLLVGINKMPGLDVYYAGDSCYEEKARNQRSAAYRLLPRYRHFSRFERAVFDSHVATEILTISDIQTPHFRHYYGTPPERFHGLPPGIEPDRIAPPDTDRIRADLRSEFGIGEDEKLLLFIGSGFIKKGLDRLLLAMRALESALLKRTRLFVIGHDHAEPFRRMVMRLGIADQVTFFAEGRDDVPRFLFSADGLVLPAYDENAGMVIIEAMLAGLPALVTANCGYAKYLKQADAGLLTPLPFEQQHFDAQLAELLTSDERPSWRKRGLAMAQHPELFQLATRAVDHLEAFARQRRSLIAFALFKFFPYGGLQRDFLRIATACLEHGYRVRVYTLSWEGPRPEGFDIIEVPVDAVTNPVRYQRFADWVRQDLAWRPASGLVGFNKMPGLDIYFAADSCYEEKAQMQRAPLYRQTRRYRLFSRFERSVFGAGADTDVLLITDQQRAQFQKYYATPDERLHLLPPGISRDRCRGPDWQTVRRDFRQDFDIADDELVLLLIGSGFITKGLDRALRAIASLPADVRARVRLFVIGEDNPRQFLGLAGELGVGAQLRIFSGRDDIPRFLQGADLMLHPAYMESGGIVLIEAIVAGLPVIATDVCGYAPYIEQADAGVLIRSPFSQETLNATLAEVIGDATIRERWSANGVSFGHTADIYRQTEHALRLIEARLFPNHSDDAGSETGRRSEARTGG